MYEAMLDHEFDFIAEHSPVTADTNASADKAIERVKQEEAKQQENAERTKAERTAAAARERARQGRMEWSATIEQAEQRERPARVNPWEVKYGRVAQAERERAEHQTHVNEQAKPETKDAK